MSYVYFAIICLLFGSNFYLMNLATMAYSPVTIGAARVLGGAAVLAIIWALSKKRETVPRGLLLANVLIGVVSSAYPYSIQPWLMGQGVEHSFLGMMVSFSPISIMLISIPVLGVWPTPRQVFGVLGGLACLAVLLLDGHHRGYSVGILVLAISVPLSYGVANAFLKKKLSGVAPLAVTMVMLLSAGSVLAPLAIAGPAAGMPGPASEPHDWLTATLALAVLGVMGTGLCMWLWVKLVSEHGPLFAGMVTYVVPVVAMLWGQFDGERISGAQLFAIAGVLAMVTLVQYGAAGKKPRVAEFPPVEMNPSEPTPAAPDGDPEAVACIGSSR
jgi:drug/metabolite transporter (DMT)-like permease